MSGAGLNLKDNDLKFLNFRIGMRCSGRVKTVPIVKWWIFEEASSSSPSYL
jgi:hypothetical protein